MKFDFTYLSGGFELRPQLKQLRDVCWDWEGGERGGGEGMVCRGELDAAVFFQLTLKHIEIQHEGAHSKITPPK